MDRPYFKSPSSARRTVNLTMQQSVAAPVDGGKWKSPHALDIALMFDNVAKSASMSGTSPQAQKVADAMSEAWIRFARSGDPGWAPYRPDARATMVFDVASKVVNDPNREERLLFADAPLVRAGSSR